MEAAGLALGVVGIVIAFKGAIDTVLLLEDFIEDDQSETRHWALRHHIQKSRLKAWGDHWKADDEELCTLGVKSGNVLKTIEMILDEITKLNQKAERLIQKHDIGQESVKLRTKFRWYIKTKNEFKDLVLKFKDLVDDLEGFTFDSNQLQLLTKAFLPQMLAEIKSTKMLQSLSDHPPEGDHTLALSAKAKLLQKQLSQHENPVKSPIWLYKPKFELIDTSSTEPTGLGLIKELDDRVIPTWIEWNVYDPGPDTKLYTQRIEDLGRLLKGVSEPALRLPPFYGVLEDLDYELKCGSKRVGYVFGAPESLVGSDQKHHAFKSDVDENPPVSLSSLIGDDSEMPPLLGDRFRLAFALATAFSLFHAAGWLHKGLHSGNILFLKESDGAISVTEPFITGFQYSRPQGQASLSRGPLEDRKLQHYYHPDAVNGFSKRLDLYSLGVVLCEIGRWGLIANTTSKQKMKTLTTREAWRKYVLSSRLKELGWRMGKKYQEAVRTLLECDLPSDSSRLGQAFFAREFQRKVLQPLSSCSA